MQGEENDVEEALDFLSPQFDPLRALATSPSKIQLPCPDVRPCDNLRMYGQVLKGTRRVYARPKEEPAPPPATPTPPPPRALEPKFSSKTVTAFMRRSDPGPFKLLQDCWRALSRVRVWTRHCVGVRGVCEGVLLAFDKHMNLVLQEVTEYYQPFRTLGNGGVEGRNKKKKKKKNKEKSDVDDSHVIRTSAHVIKGCCHVIENVDTFQSRTLSRLFVRGDNVVIVSSIR